MNQFVKRGNDDIWQWTCRICGYITSPTKKTRVMCGCDFKRDWGSIVAAWLFSWGIRKSDKCNCPKRERAINGIGYLFYAIKYRVFLWLMKSR